LPIVEYLDVLGDLPDGLFPGHVSIVMNKLIFELSPEALHGSIIIAIPFSQTAAFWALKSATNITAIETYAKRVSASSPSVIAYPLLLSVV
jgi:hypothetical protein